MLFGGLFEVTDLIMHSPQIIDQNNILKREKYHRRIIIFVAKDFISVKSVFKSFKVRHSQNLNQSLTTMCLTTHKQPTNYKIGFVK